MKWQLYTSTLFFLLVIFACSNKTIKQKNSPSKNKTSKSSITKKSNDAFPKNPYKKQKSLRYKQAELAKKQVKEQELKDSAVLFGKKIIQFPSYESWHASIRPSSGVFFDLGSNVDVRVRNESDFRARNESLPLARNTMINFSHAFMESENISTVHIERARLKITKRIARAERLLASKEYKKANKLLSQAKELARWMPYQSVDFNVWNNKILFLIKLSKKQIPPQKWSQTLDNDIQKEITLGKGYLQKKLYPKALFHLKRAKEYSPLLEKYSNYKVKKQTEELKKLIQKTQASYAKIWQRINSTPNTAHISIGKKELLQLKGMRVMVKVEGLRARTIVDYVFYNPYKRQLEGSFRYHLPNNASICYFAYAPNLKKKNNPKIGDTSVILPALPIQPKNAKN